MWAVNTHTHTHTHKHTKQLLSDQSGGRHTVEPLAALELTDCKKISRTKTRKSARVWKGGKNESAFPPATSLKCLYFTGAARVHCPFSPTCPTSPLWCLLGLIFWWNFERQGSHQGPNYSFKDCLVSSIFYGRYQSLPLLLPDCPFRGSLAQYQGCHFSWHWQ